MKLNIRFAHLIVVLSLVLSACTAIPATGNDAMEDKPPATEVMMEKDTATSEAMMDKKDDTMMEEGKPTHDVMMDKGTGTPEAMMDDKQDDKMMESPAWFKAALTDVSSGETFTLADYQGKVVLVETMAIWCSNCLRQQKELKALREQLGNPEDFVTVTLDIDSNENSEQLKAYIEKNGFSGRYAVAPAEVSREISELYGAQFLNPPSAPIVLIDRNGKAQVLQFGVKSAQDLQSAIEPLLKDNM